MTKNNAAHSPADKHRPKQRDWQKIHTSNTAEGATVTDAGLRSVAKNTTAATTTTVGWYRTELTFHTAAWWAQVTLY